MKENARRREAEEKQRKARIAKEKAEREKQERQMKKRRLLEVNTGEMFISHSLKVFTRVSFREITFEDGWKKPLHTFLGARFKPAEVCPVVSPLPSLILYHKHTIKYNSVTDDFEDLLCSDWVLNQADLHLHASYNIYTGFYTQLSEQSSTL